MRVDVRRAGACWQLDVVDSGRGVPVGDRERIFERLVRLDASRSRNTGGFGLGLPIARAMARTHGGDLVCLGTEIGARFRLTLPVSSDAHQVVPSSEPRDSMARERVVPAW